MSSLSCNTCNEPISSNCINYQGKDLYFSSDLTNKRDLNELILKLSKELEDLKKLVNTPLDPKGLDIPCNIKTLPDFVQYLLDKQVQQTSNTSTYTSTFSGTVNLGVGCSTGNCGSNTVSIDTAFLIICSELEQIKNQLNSNSNLYIPNV